MNTQTQTEQVLAANTWRKLISGKPYGEAKRVELTVTAQLVKRAGNSYPYFTITGEVKKVDKRYRDPVITCGAIHEVIVEQFPNLAPLVAVHLSAADGQPMHAEANARYWCGLSTYADGSPMGEYKPRMLAQHLQCDRATAAEVYEALKRGLPWQTITSTLKLVELWSTQAGAARKLLIDTAVI
jgi:hypothetical protein